MSFIGRSVELSFGSGRFLTRLSYAHIIAGRFAFTRLFGSNRCSNLFQEGLNAQKRNRMIQNAVGLESATEKLEPTHLLS